MALPMTSFFFLIFFDLFLGARSVVLGGGSLYSSSSNSLTAFYNISLY